LVTAGDVFLVRAPPLGEAFPDRWWVPGEALLDTIVPGGALVKVLAMVAGEDGGADLWSAAPIWFAVEQRDGETLGGTITSSRLGREGYLEGDRIMASVDRVVDLVALGEEGEPLLNEERVRFAIGKRVLIGVTVRAPGGELVEQRQLVGMLAGVHPENGIEFILDDGTAYCLPPDSRSLEEARPGEYQLRSTGQVVVDPDYVTSWTVNQLEGVA
jgi:hypothetical protein